MFLRHLQLPIIFEGIGGPVVDGDEAVVVGDVGDKVGPVVDGVVAVGVG